jgi:hypothetical protein
VRVALALLVLSLAPPAPADAAAPADSLDYVGWFRMGMAARESGNDAEFLRCLRRSSGLAPWHPTPAYRLAGAWARNGERRRAIALLRSLLRQDLAYDFDTNPDFEPLHRARAWRSLLRERDRIREPRV